MTGHKKWAVGFLSKNLLYANSLDRLVDNHAIAKFYYILLSNNYIVYKIELKYTNCAGLTNRSDIGKLAAARSVNCSKSGAVLTILPLLGFYAFIKHHQNMQIASSM